MFLILLVVTLAIAAVSAGLVAWIFDQSIGKILRRIVSDELAIAWHRYVKFAIYVVGISGGVRIREIEKYITPRDKDNAIIVLNADRWTLEVYRTIIQTLQSVAWMLLVFFGIALIAYVIVRGIEFKYGNQPGHKLNGAG